MESDTGKVATEGQEFVSAIRPILEQRDPWVLLEHLERNVTIGQLRALLYCEDQDAVKVAVFCFAWLGTMDHVAEVARQLHSPDKMVAFLAEHALWSIWFRAGDARANADLHEAVHLIHEGRLDAAIETATRILGRCPDYAEAYNQRAIAHFLKGDYAPAVEDCQDAIVRNPCHFGALAGLGHCYAVLGKLELALSAYRRALAIYPRMDGMRESIRQIRRGLARSQSADGFPSTQA